MLDDLQPSAFWASVLAQPGVDRQRVAALIHWERGHIDLRGELTLKELPEGLSVVKRYRTHSTDFLPHFKQAVEALNLCGLSTPPYTVTDVDDHCLLEVPFLGVSLAHNLEVARSILPFKQFQLIVQKMIELGVDWSGFAPRNIIPSGGVLLAIDLDECHLVEPQSSMPWPTRWRLQLAWGQVYGREQVEDFLTQIGPPAQVTALDPWEALWGTITPCNSMQDIAESAAQAVLGTELYPFRSGFDLTTFDVAHVLDELLNTPCSVLFTLYLQRRISEGKAPTFLSDMELALRRSAVEWSKGASLDVVRAILLGAWAASHRDLDASSRPQLHQCSCKPGSVDSSLAKALQRAAIAEESLMTICRIIEFALRTPEQVELVLRGSLGNGVLTEVSDVDFSVVESDRIAFEPLIADFAAGLGFGIDGSDELPGDDDVVVGGDSLDMHNVFESRRLGSDAPWYINASSERYSNLLLGNSTWERSVRARTSKLLFSKVRVLINRLHVRKIGVSLPRTCCALTEIASKDRALAARVTALLQAAISAYESDAPAQRLDALFAEVDVITSAEIPSPPGPKLESHHAHSTPKDAS